MRSRPASHSGAGHLALPGYHGATAYTLGLNGERRAPALWGLLTVESAKIPALPLSAPRARRLPPDQPDRPTVDRLGPDRAFVLS
jgi:hypothetical protein